MTENNFIIEISVLEHKLMVKKDSAVITSYPIATGKYPEHPKYWSWDYRTPIGEYFVKFIHRKNSETLTALNSKEYPWYLIHKARDVHKETGSGVYGDGVIALNYPNLQDIIRFREAKESGQLKKMWVEFCDRHWKPIYEYIAQESNTDFDQVSLEGDFGLDTYRELLESFPVSESKIALGPRTAIHGTNDPDCIGRDISGGCIRMHNKDIKQLINIVKNRTTVIIRP